MTTPNPAWPISAIVYSTGMPAEILRFMASSQITREEFLPTMMDLFGYMPESPWLRISNDLRDGKTPTAVPGPVETILSVSSAVRGLYPSTAWHYMHATSAQSVILAQHVLAQHSISSVGDLQQRYPAWYAIINADSPISDMAQLVQHLASEMLDPDTANRRNADQRIDVSELLLQDNCAAVVKRLLAVDSLPRPLAFTHAYSEWHLVNQSLLATLSAA